MGWSRCVNRSRCRCWRVPPVLSSCVCSAQWLTTLSSPPPPPPPPASSWTGTRCCQGGSSGVRCVGYRVHVLLRVLRDGQANATRDGTHATATDATTSSGVPACPLTCDAVTTQIQNMALALCGIAFASLVFLGSLHVTAIIVLMIALIDVALLGCVPVACVQSSTLALAIHTRPLGPGTLLMHRSLHYFGIKLNSISVVRGWSRTRRTMVWLTAAFAVTGVVAQINLVLATGLSVDYSAHICHRFLESNHTNAAAAADVEGVTGKGSAVGGAVTAVDRAEEAVWQLGASVFNAGMSTLLAVLPLGLAQSTVFFTFFTMMTSIVRSRWWANCGPAVQSSSESSDIRGAASAGCVGVGTWPRVVTCRLRPVLATKYRPTVRGCDNGFRSHGCRPSRTTRRRSRHKRRGQGASRLFGRSD